MLVELHLPASFSSFVNVQNTCNGGSESVTMCLWSTPHVVPSSSDVLHCEDIFVADQRFDCRRLTHGTSRLGRQFISFLCAQPRRTGCPDRVGPRTRVLRGGKAEERSGAARTPPGGTTPTTDQGAVSKVTPFLNNISLGFQYNDTCIEPFSWAVFHVLNISCGL